MFTPRAKANELLIQQLGAVFAHYCDTRDESEIALKEQVAELKARIATPKEYVKLAKLDASTTKFDLSDLRMTTKAEIKTLKIEITTLKEKHKVALNNAVVHANTVSERGYELFRKQMHTLPTGADWRHLEFKWEDTPPTGVRGDQTVTSKADRGDTSSPVSYRRD